MGTLEVTVRQARESSDSPILNAFCRVAPSVRFRDLAIFLRAFSFVRATCCCPGASFSCFPSHVWPPILQRRLLLAGSDFKRKPRTLKRGMKLVAYLDQLREDERGAHGIGTALVAPAGVLVRLHLAGVVASLGHADGGETTTAIPALGCL